MASTNRQQASARGRNNATERDDEGRFMSNDRSQGRGGRYDEDDYGAASQRQGRDQDRGRQGGWFGDAEGYSEAARGWDDRQSSSRGRASGRYESEEDDRSYSPRSANRASQYEDDDYRGSQRQGREQDDRYGYSESMRRGSDDRQSSSRGRASGRYEDDRDDRSFSSRSEGRGRDGQGGWFGDSQGHAETSRRGWEDRR